MHSSEATGLSQDMGSLLSEPSCADAASQGGQDDDELTPIIPPTGTPDTSVSPEEGQAATKRAKNSRGTK